MDWTVYIRKGKVYIPSVARTTDGILIGTEPVEAASVEDREALREAVAAVIGRGMPTVPPPPRDAYKKSPTLAQAGVKSWTTFYKGTRQLAFMRGGQGFEIVRIVPYGDGEDGYKNDDSSRIILSGDLPMAQVVERIVEEIQRER